MTVGLQGTVVVQDVVELGIASAGDVPAVPVRRYVGRRGRRGVGVAAHVPVQVLAYHRGAVAGVVERGGERVLLLAARVELVEPAVPTDVAVDAGVVREVAGEDR